MLAAANSLDLVFTLALLVAAAGFVVGAGMFFAARAGRRPVQGATMVMTLSLVVYLVGGVAGAAVRVRSTPATPPVTDEGPIAKAETPEPATPVAEPTTPAATPATATPATPTPAPTVTPAPEPTPPPVAAPVPTPPPTEAAAAPEETAKKKTEKKKKKKKKTEGDDATGEYMDEDAPSLPKDTKPAEPEDELKPLSPKPKDEPKEEPKDEPKGDDGPKTPSGFGEGG